MGLIYRRPEVREAEALATLHVQCWREAYVEFLPPELMASFSVEKRLPMWLAVIPNMDRVVCAAFENGVPVGFAIAGATTEQFIESQDGHLYSLYIAASHYRKGIGLELLSRIAREWMSHGGRTMTLGVLAQNIRARSFYESLGAKLVKLTSYKWDGHELPDAIYVFEDLKRLTP